MSDTDNSHNFVLLFHSFLFIIVKTDYMYISLFLQPLLIKQKLLAEYV